MWSLLIFFMLISLSILGSGYWLPTFGPRSTARGSAFIAKADDLTAVNINPANMVKFKGLNTFVSLATINTRGSVFYYNRPFVENPEYPIDDRTTYNKEILNIPDLFFNPTVVISHDFGLKKWNFSFAAYGPYAPDYSYDKKCSTKKQPLCPNRYSLYESDITLANFQLTAAYQILPNLSAGIGLKNSYINFRYNLDIIAAGGELGTLMDNQAREGKSDVNVDFDVSDYINPNFNFGLTYQFQKFTFAFHYQSPIDVDADGTYKSKIYSTSEVLINAETEIVGNDMNVKLNLPHVFGIGIMFEEPNFFNVEVDFKYEMWSVHKEVVIDLKNSIAKMSSAFGDIKLNKIVQTKKWEDTFTLSLGGDMFLNQLFTLSMGCFYEKGAIPDEYYDSSIIDGDKYGVGLGLSYKWTFITFFTSFSYITFDQKDIINSKVYPGNPMQYDYPKDFIVGNGRYKTDMFIFSTGVNGNF